MQKYLNRYFAVFILDTLDPKNVFSCDWLEIAHKGNIPVWIKTDK